MRKVWKRLLVTALATATAFNTMPAMGVNSTGVAKAATEDVDSTVKLLPGKASTFNDTNGDGLGEFEGFGTSLCWWANRVGYSEKLTQAAAEAFYGDDGLRMNIGRYNIGGGDNVGTAEEVSVNEKADIYDLSGDTLLPTYDGAKMSIGTTDSFSSTAYSVSDADFGITSGYTVGSLNTIGWINALDGAVGNGGNLHYTVKADETGEYTVKMIFTLTGSNSRGVSMKVTASEKDEANSSSSSTSDDSANESSSDNENAANEASSQDDSALLASSQEEVKDDSSDSASSADSSIEEPEEKEDNADASSGAASAEDAATESVSENSEEETQDSSESTSADVNLYSASENYDGYTVYTVESSEVNSNVIASASNAKLFLVTFTDVELSEGENKIDIGGAGDDWCLDFVKMAVIKEGDEGVLPETSDFLHASHITRSDSVVPGYCIDVTKIDLDKHTQEWYEENFVRADFDCGYAWNYDWDADANQINVVKAAAAQSGEDFIAEAFSNSPPYFMTVSGCSSGNFDAGEDNLRADSYTAFANYMADVIEHWNNEGVFEFQSVSPMNEPYTSYWGAYSNKQEGCHFDIGTSESNILVALNTALEEKGIDIIISASDETSIDTAIEAYNALTDEAKEVVTRIDTHTYSGSKRAQLKALAQESGENLWMSEVDGSGTAGTDAGEMAPALWLANYMMT
ncbi:MAG: xylosidase/arabinofuranosidase, partial [Butyrivibrio sp.]|nr:xylosidase/arabinofuranosidase [Butyrivibrio sp.]